MTNFAFLPDRFRAIGEAKLHGGGPRRPQISFSAL